MQDYNKNEKPLVKATATASPFKLNDQDLAPIARPTAPKAAFGSSVMPKNSVSKSTSAKLQSAIRLPGRATIDGGKAPFAK